MDRIGKYESLERIGRGAMGVVYKAHDPFLERPVAIKMMSADFEGEPELLSRFFREARVAVQLKHPNIIDVHDLAEEDGRAYIVMELLDGEDLKEKLKRREYIPLERRLQMMLDLCSALAYAHDREVVHRDLKPGNIQITASGRVKVLDFGLARIADSDMTATGMVMGTPSYMSPEQLEGKKVDERSDIFALGSVFYELFSYRKAFEGRTLAEAFAKIAREDPVPLHEVNPTIPEQLSAIIQKALQKGRDDRHQSMAEMGADLEAFQKSLPELQRQMRAAAEAAIEKLRNLKEANADLVAESRALADADVDGDATVRVEAPALDDSLPSPEAASIGEASGYLELYRARQLAEVERGQLQDLLAKLEPLAPYLEQDLRHIADDDLAGAVAEVDALLEDYPRNARAIDLQARLTEEQGRRQRAAKTYATARQARETGELEKAGALAAEILGEDSKHIDAQQLAGEVEEEIERLERERREREERQRRIGELLEKAGALEAAGELEAAMQAVREALQLDEGDEAALRLAQQIEAALEQARKRQQRLAKTYAMAVEARQAGELEKAAQLSAEILEEAPEHGDAAELAAEVKAEIERLEQERIEREERLRRIGELLERAESLRDEGDLEASREAVGEALQLDHGHEAALRLERQVDAAIEKALERQQRLARTYALAVEARQAGELEKAAELASQVLEEEPEHTEAAELATAVKAEIESFQQERREHEERQRRIGELLEKAESLRGAGDLEAARKAAREALRLDESHAPAKKLRATLDREIKKERQRQKGIAKALAAATKAQQGGKLERARELAEQVLGEDPEQAEAKQLVAEVDAEVERLGEERRAQEERQRREAERLEAEKREAEKREAEKREAEKREAEKREAEKREAEKREAEKREAEKREAEKREAARLEAERRETQRRESERREAEKREAERRDAQRRQAERREAALADTRQIETGAPKQAAAGATDVAPWQRVPQELLSTVRDRPALLLLPLAAIVLASALALWPSGPDAGDEEISATGGGETSGPSTSGGGATVPAGGTSGTTTATPLDFTEELAAARQQLEGGDFDAALAAVGGILDQQPDNSEAQRLRQQASQRLIEVRGREARDHLAAGRGEEALATAQAVLAVDPDNQQALEVQQSVRDSLGELLANLSEARSHLEANRYGQAAAAAQAVLDSAPGNGEARTILGRADEGAAMDRARSQAIEARRDAEAAGAPEAAGETWGAAARLQDEADGLVAQGRWSDAADRYNSARARFDAASEDAAAASRTLRIAAETARDDYMQTPQQLQTRSPLWGTADFAAAAGPADAAQAALDRGDYAAARSGWEGARDLLVRAARGALADKRNLIAGQAQALQQQPLAAPVPSATTRITTADAEENAGNLLAAAQALDEALSHYREAAAILSVLDQYRQAFEDRSMDRIRQVWPGVVGTTSEDFIRVAFQESSVSLEIQSVDTEIDLPDAEHVWTVRYRIGSTTTPSARQRIELRKQDGRWLIQSMTQEEQR